MAISEKSWAPRLAAGSRPPFGLVKGYGKIPRSNMSLKRFLADHLVPYSGLLDRTNWTSKWCRTVEQADCPMFATREDLYRYLQKLLLRDAPIDYLEFGVADGASLRSWCDINRHQGSRFWGFDCFTGLPEDWNEKRPKGTFSQNGIPPEIGDARVRFEVGLFQDTLPAFVNSYQPANSLVIHNDSDLYSSTLYTLTMLDRVCIPDSVVIFDEFSDALHEYRALIDYSGAYRRKFRVIAATRRFDQAAVVLY